MLIVEHISWPIGASVFNTSSVVYEHSFITNGKVLCNVSERAGSTWL